MSHQKPTFIVLIISGFSFPILRITSWTLILSVHFILITLLYNYNSELFKYFSFSFYSARFVAIDHSTPHKVRKTFFLKAILLLTSSCFFRLHHFCLTDVQHYSKRFPHYYNTPPPTWPVASASIFLLSFCPYRQTSAYLMNFILYPPITSIDISYIKIYIE